MTNQTQANSQWATNIPVICAILVGVVILPRAVVLGFRAAASSLPAYVLCGLAGIGFTVWASYKMSANWARRLIYTAVGVVLLGWLLLLPLRYSNYQQPAHPALGHQMQWVTQPNNSVTDAFKQFQHAFEIQCDFSLLGWTESGNLQYISVCLPGVWTYSPTLQRTSWALFHFDSPNEQVTRWDGHQYPVHPTSLSQNEFSYLTLERAIAPNGQWEAVVVRWFYGPSDVVIISLK